MVSRLSARVADHRNPEVVTPLVANMGVSHSQVLPARNRATPPTFRMVNMTITSLSDCAHDRWQRLGTKVPRAVDPRHSHRHVGEASDGLRFVGSVIGAVLKGGDESPTH